MILTFFLEEYISNITATSPSLTWTGVLSKILRASRRSFEGDLQNKFPYRGFFGQHTRPSRRWFGRGLQQTPPPKGFATFLLKNPQVASFEGGVFFFTEEFGHFLWHFFFDNFFLEKKKKRKTHFFLRHFFSIIFFFWKKKRKIEFFLLKSLVTFCDIFCR